MKKFQIFAAICASILLMVFVAAAIYRFSAVDDGNDMADLVQSPAPATPSTPDVVSCPIEATGIYAEEQNKLLTQWDDAVRLAESTSRIGLSPVVSTLQSLRRDALDLPTPDCAQPLRELQSIFMNYEIDAFLAFMQEAKDDEVQNLMVASFLARSAFDTHFTVFSSDPLLAHSIAHEWENLSGAYSPTEGWIDLQLFDAESAISFPQEWASEISAPNKVTLRNKQSMFAFVLESRPQDEFPDVKSPLVYRVTMNSLSASVGGKLDTFYVKYGHNTGYRIGSPYAEGNRIIRGLTRTPDGHVYEYLAQKSSGSITKLEEDTIYTILSSIR